MSEYRSSVQYAGVADVHGLLAALKATDARDRQHARELLIAVGRPAVGPLVRLLDDPDHRVRWEAVKTLAAIGDPAAAPALIDALEDDAADVRWVAAQALIDLGHEALRPLLSGAGVPSQLAGIAGRGAPRAQPVVLAGFAQAGQARVSRAERAVAADGRPLGRLFRAQRYAHEPTRLSTYSPFPQAREGPGVRAAAERSVGQTFLSAPQNAIEEQTGMSAPPC